MLFVANVLYLVYELRGAESNFIPVLITMYFFLNFASIISFKVITMDNSTDHSFLSIPARKFIGFLMILLVLIYVSIFFTGFGTNGIKCTAEERSKGLCFMSSFLFFWTIYVIYSLRGEEIVKIKTDNVKEIFKFTKEMALNNKKKPEFNADIMQVAQRRMFILL